MTGIKKTTNGLLMAVLLLNSCGRISAGYLPQNPVTPETENRRLIIKRKLNSSAKTLIASQDKLKSVKSLGIEVVNVPEGISVPDYLKKLSADPSIEYIEPDYIRKISLSEESFRNNTNFDLKNYLLQNTVLTKVKSLISAQSAQNFFNDPDIKLQYGLDNINAEKAWGFSSGTDKVVIAVVDTGVDLGHPDLQNNLMNGYSAINGVVTPQDDNGHGTHVAGIIAAISNNNKGGVGLAPKCKIMPVKVLSGKGEGSDSDIAEGIIWAVDHGANVINLSLGGTGAGKTLERAMTYAFNSNVLVIAAMGNNGENLKTYPAAYKNIIAVGATDVNNKVVPFSNYGDWISVSAPGLKIYSTFPREKVELSRYNLSPNYAVLSGTSMAVPFVAALAGLIMSKNPGINRAEVRKKIENSSLDVDQKGFDENTGFGLIDAYKSLNTK
jgi:subtilisin family serine protease